VKFAAFSALNPLRLPFGRQITWQEPKRSQGGGLLRPFRRRSGKACLL